MSSLQPRIARLKTNEVFVVAGEVVGCKNFRGYLEKCETCFNGGPTNKSCLKRYPKKLQRWEDQDELLQ